MGSVHPQLLRLRSASLLMVLLVWTFLYLHHNFKPSPHQTPSPHQEGRPVIPATPPPLDNAALLEPDIFDVMSNRSNVHRPTGPIDPNSAVLTPVVPGSSSRIGVDGGDPEPHCHGKRIFMYDLPPQFNTNILQQCDRNITEWLTFCAHVQNDGFGQDVNATTGWYGTDSYMLEVIFHARMKNYACLTDKQEEADAFFFPYYSGLDALRFLYGKDELNRRKQGLELVEWLEENGGYGWRKWGGLDHFLVMGRTAWDFSVDVAENVSKWGTSLRAQPVIANVTALVLESRPWATFHEQAVPYPTSFHPPTMEALNAWVEEVRAASRPFLFTFVGAPRPGPVGSIRQAALEQCLSSSSQCGLLDCSQIKCAHNPVPIRDTLLSSQFCLQPPGDTATRRSSFDAMIAGCIPVFFHNDTAYSQYTWHLPSQHDQYSVFIPFEDIQKGDVKVQELLASYSEERIEEMRANIIDLIPRIIYLSPSAAMEMHKVGIKDAFDLSLEGILNKVSHFKSSASASPGSTDQSKH